MSDVMMGEVIAGFSFVLSFLLGVVVLLIVRRAGRGSSVRKEVERTTSSLLDLKIRFDAIHESFVNAEAALPLTRELRALEKDHQKKTVEVSVAASELEVLESRLAELESIRKEVGASAEVIKQELQTLKDRESELLSRRQELESMLAAFAERMSSISSELAMSEEMKVQIERMKSELLGTEEQCDKLLLQIQRGNEQCMSMKQRYNALDIEYSLLFERLSRLEGARVQAQVRRN